MKLDQERCRDHRACYQFSFLDVRKYSRFLLLIPKPEPTPRSILTPRFPPMSNYPLYSSLVFHRSQAPISIAIKHHAQPRSPPTIRSWPRHHSSSAGHVSFPQMVTGQPPLTLSAYTPWRPEVNYIRRIVLHHQFLFTVGNKTVQMFGSFGLCIEYIF